MISAYFDPIIAQCMPDCDCGCCIGGDDPYRLGILGGTFDPPHIGHLVLAECARAAADLDGILFVPAGQPSRKLGCTVATPEQRLEMVRLAIADEPRWHATDIEVTRPGITYTVDTVYILKAVYGARASLYLIAGSDSTADLMTWKDAAELAAMVKVLNGRRPGAPPPPADTLFQILDFDMPALDLSSTELRQRLVNGGTIRYLVPDSVIEYCKANNIYG